MKLVDSHCHLELEPLKNFKQEAVERAHKAGISKIVNVGNSLRSSKESVEIANQYPHIWATIGLHPHEAGNLTDLDRTIEELRELARSDKVVAIGECGLDYYQIKNQRSKIKIIEEQKLLFLSQLKLASELDMPVIIHSRDSESDTLEILRATNDKRPTTPRGVIHCFTYGPDTAEKFLELGFYIGFTGFITFDQPKFDNIREAAKAVPLDRILIETDAPFLAPEPNRGKTNEPAFVADVAAKLAEIKKVSVEEIAEKTTENTEKLFSI